MLQQVLLTAGGLPLLRSHHLPGALAGGGIARLQQCAVVDSTWRVSVAHCAFRAVHTSSSSSSGDGSQDGRTTASSSTTTTAAPQQQRASSSSSSKLQLPPAMASGAGAAAAAATNAAKAAAKQASKLIKLVQATSLSEATRLQLSSTWAAHSTALTAAAGTAATAGAYLSAAAVAGQFGVDMSQPGAYLSCLSASAAAVTATGLHVRSSFTVDPDRVYRVALRKLGRHAGLQEVMGAPLAGSETRLQLVTSGSLFVQETLLPRVRAPRIHMVFQLSGPVKSGVVSLEAAKAVGGKYRFQTLMVELPDKALAGPWAEAACEAAAAAAMARVRQAAAPVTGRVPPATTSSSSSSSGSSGSGSSSSQDSAASSLGADAAAAADGSSSSTESNPARIYIIGGPEASSSKGGSQSQQLSTRAVLEELKTPLIYALKRNLAVYEAEDEFGGELASSTQVDPDQATWWDSGKAAAKHAACRSVAVTCSTWKRLKAAVIAAQAARQKAAAAAAAAAPATSGSSKGGAAAAQQQPSAAVPAAADAAGSSSSDAAASLPAASTQAAAAKA